MQYCTNCGRKIEGNVKFCPGCGKQLLFTSPAKNNNVVKALTLIGGIVGIIFGFIYMLIFFAGNSNSFGVLVPVFVILLSIIGLIIGISIENNNTGNTYNGIFLIVIGLLVAFLGVIVFGIVQAILFIIAGALLLKDNV